MIIITKKKKIIILPCNHEVGNTDQCERLNTMNENKTSLGSNTDWGILILPENTGDIDIPSSPFIK